MYKKIAILIMVLTVLAFALPCAAESSASDDNGWKNYIVVVDNSGSNIYDTTATGEATDPNGLRFSTCKLLYDLLAPEYNRIGLIVFSGPGEYCKSYGPIERGSLSADAVFRNALDDPSVVDYRNNKTDINSALQEALRMERTFPNGRTTIVLLTDGVNDLTDSATALKDEINIQANEVTIQTARSFVEEGIDFYVVALTAESNSSFRDVFLDFINRLALAGGGTKRMDDTLDNVYEAYDKTLVSAIQEILGVQNDEVIDTSKNLLTPTTDTFSVPYNGITEASITITFAVEDKDKLETITLTSPSGTEDLIWNASQTASPDPSMFTIEEDQNYINIKILEPQSGTWTISVQGAEGTSIDETIKMSQNVRLVMEQMNSAVAGSPVTFHTRFQKYAAGAYSDIKDIAIYQDSSATLTLISPSGKKMDVEMTPVQASYVAEAMIDEEGDWQAKIVVSNPYLSKSIDQYGFHAEAAPAVLTTDTFKVPYNGITEASITITSAIEDKDKLETITLTSPSGTEDLIWNASRTASPDPSMFTIEEDQNYINFKIHEPQSGTWTISVQGAEGTSIEETIKISQNVRLVMEQVNSAVVGSTVTLRTRFQKNEAGANSEIEDSRIYQDSYATLTLTSPSGKTKDVEMTPDQASYAAEAMIDEEGDWRAKIVVTIPYFDESVDQFNFHAEAAPVAAAYEPTLQIAPLKGEENGVSYVDNNADKVQLAWQVAGEVESLRCTVTSSDSLLPLIEVSDANFCEINQTELKSSVTYTVVITEIPKFGTADDAIPYTWQFALYPEPSVLRGFRIEPRDVDHEDDGVFVVDGNTAMLGWSVDSGKVGSVIYEIAGSDGSADALELDSTQETASFSIRNNVVYTINAKAVPQYGSEEDAERYQASVRMTPLVLTFTQRLMRLLPYIGAAAGLLVLAIVSLLLLRRARLPRLSGTLALRCVGPDGEYIATTIKLTGSLSGSRLSQIDKNLKAKCGENKGYPLLANIVLVKEEVGEDGTVHESSSMFGDAKLYPPKSAAIMVRITDLGEVVVVDDFGTETREVTTTDELGETFQFAFAYSTSTQYPYID